jgi:hypothetical protein
MLNDSDWMPQDHISACCMTRVESIWRLGRRMSRCSSCKEEADGDHWAWCFCSFERGLTCVAFGCHKLSKGTILR